MAEDGALELAQLGRRLDPELVERGSSRPVGLQRLLLPTAAIEGQHLLTAEALPERMLRDERLQLAQYDVVAAERELGLAEELSACSRRSSSRSRSAWASGSAARSASDGPCQSPSASRSRPAAESA